MTDYYTPVPNVFFDKVLPTLSESEVKVLLVIIRHTYGWHKERDWISHSQFMKKTSLSKRSISDAIGKLSSKRIIVVSDSLGRPVFKEERKGNKKLWYGIK